MKNNKDYDQKMQISNEIQADLKWWKSRILTKKNPIRNLNYKFKICLNDSLTGWGACCDDQKTHGWWDLKDKKNQ